MVVNFSGLVDQETYAFMERVVFDEEHSEAGPSVVSDLFSFLQTFLSEFC